MRTRLFVSTHDLPPVFPPWFLLPLKGQFQSEAPITNPNHISRRTDRDKMRQKETKECEAIQRANETLKAAHQLIGPDRPDPFNLPRPCFTEAPR